MWKLRRGRDQVSWLRHIKLRCLHVHRRPARKRGERVPAALFLIQICDIPSLKKSWAAKPSWSQMFVEKRQSQRQCRMVSSPSSHLEQVAEGAMWQWWRRDKVCTPLWQASQTNNLNFSRILSFHIQDQVKGDEGLVSDSPTFLSVCWLFYVSAMSCIVSLYSYATPTFLSVFSTFRFFITILIDIQYKVEKIQINGD